MNSGYVSEGTNVMGKKILLIRKKQYIEERHRVFSSTSKHSAGNVSSSGVRCYFLVHLSRLKKCPIL